MMLKTNKVISFEYEPFQSILWSENEMYSKFGVELKPEKQVITVTEAEARNLLRMLEIQFKPRQAIKEILNEELPDRAFELNDDSIRAELKDVLDRYLSSLDGSLVVCDGSNNPPEIIDNNLLVVDVYIPEGDEFYRIIGIVHEDGVSITEEKWT